jgi:hypothetical protein
MTGRAGKPWLVNPTHDISKPLLQPKQDVFAIV